MRALSSAIAKIRISASSSICLIPAPFGLYICADNSSNVVNEFTGNAALPHDFRVMENIGSGRGILRQRIHVAQAADFLRLAGAGQRFEHRDDVGGTRSIDQFDDVLKNDAVIVAVKIGFVQHAGDAIPGGVFEQQAAEDGLLGLDRVRRNPQVGKVWSIAELF